MPRGATSRLNAAVAEVLARNPRDAEEREEAIEEVCRDDLALARRVRRRLAEQLEATQSTEAGIQALGPYLLLAPIGEGGMGAVYRARDARLRREVAVKVLSPAVAAQPDLVERFEREARAVAALSHRNVVVIYDVGYEADTHFLVMELLDGQSLREAAARGRMPAPQVTSCIVQVCAGLAAAHGKGIVHRDLKPGNIILTRDGRAVLVDFGIAKTLTDEGGDQSTFVTTAGGVLGTPQYMSPEQVRGLRVDHRSDIFSLGVILFELLTGESAFERPTLADCLSAVLTEDPLERWDRDAHPPELRSVVERCLDKDPGRRFQSAADLAAAVGALAESARAGAGAELAEITGVAGTTRDLLTDAGTARPGRGADVRLGVERTSGVGSRIAGGAAMAAALLVAAGIWMTRGEAPADAPEPVIDGSVQAPPAAAGLPVDVEPAASRPVPQPVGEGSREDRARPAPAAAPPVPVAAVRPAPAGGGRADVRPGVEPADARPRIDVAARDEHRRRAFDAFAGGDHRESLRLAESGLQLYRGDPELRRLLGDLESSARTRARFARDSAAEEAAVRASTQYAGADARFEDARRLAGDGRPVAAIRTFWAAEEMFDAATLAADVESARPDAAREASRPWAGGSTTPGLSGTAGGGRRDPDGAGIRAVLDEYRRAYESRSSAAVRRVDPGLTTDELRALDREFLEWTAYRRELEVLRESVGADRAEVVVAITDHITPRIGVARQVGRQAVFSLERPDGRWTVVDVRYVD